MNYPADPVAPKEPGSREEGLKEAILNYLEAHPHAMDTLDGIADWWVGPNQVCGDFGLLARVLGQMVHEGTLEQVGDGPHTLYRMTRKVNGRDRRE